MTGVLAGLRAIDLSDGIPGAYCTKLLADAGADVLLLEPPEGHPLRRYSASGAPLPPGEDGALFRFLCASKRSACADPSTAAGRARALDLARDADLVIESFTPGTIESLGLGLDALHARNPRAALISISPFGRGGPWSRRPATEFTLQALCGSTASRGEPERPPLAAGGRLGDWMGGAFAAVGALLALRRRDATGRGEHVDVSLFEATSISLCFYEHLHASLSEDPEAFTAGFGRALEVPSIEPAADGFVGFALFTAQMWTDFCELVERPELAADRELHFMLSRWPRREEIRRAIGPWLRAHSVEEIVERAGRRGIPAAPIGTGATLPRMEPFASRGTFVETPGDGGLLQPCVPYRLSRACARPFAPAPPPHAHAAAPWSDAPPPRPPDASAASPNAAPAPPLAGLRVVDFTQFLAGPLVTHVFAAMGADVVKVEAVQRPDGIRFASARPPEHPRWWEYSWCFHGLNPGKRSITLDLTRPEGLALAKRLVEGADLVVENFAPRAIEQLGLGFEEVARLNPRAVMVRMPAFGLSGPWRDRGGLAQTMEQLSGLAFRTGYRDGPPVIPRGPCDAVAGVHAAFAALLALAHRDRTGEGQLVESVMVEAALNVAAEQVLEHSAYGRLLERDGNRDPRAEPQDVYACRGEERWLALSVESDAQWAALVAWLGGPAWAADASLAGAAGRRAARERIDLALREAFAGCDAARAAEELTARGVPAAPVVLSPRVADHPQHRARRFYAPLDHPLAGRQRYPVLPMRFSGDAERSLAGPPPLLGQHNDDVLGRELGLPREQLAALRAAGVVGEEPIGF